MPFITFGYKIKNNIYYGKHVTDYISDDHEGLDLEIKNKLLDSINKYRRQKKYQNINDNDISIGVLSFSSNSRIPVYSSEEEIKFFNYYHEDINYKRKTYINGKLLE